MRLEELCRLEGLNPGCNFVVDRVGLEDETNFIDSHNFTECGCYITGCGACYGTRITL